VDGFWKIVQYKDIPSVLNHFYILKMAIICLESEIYIVRINILIINFYYNNNNQKSIILLFNYLPVLSVL